MYQLYRLSSPMKGLFDEISGFLFISSNLHYGTDIFRKRDHLQRNDERIDVRSECIFRANQQGNEL